MNVLITGATGMLGSVLSVTLDKSFNIYTTGKSLKKSGNKQNYKSFDLMNNSYDELIEWANPDMIIHCAAITNGNYCNDNSLYALNVNGVSVKKLLDATDPKVKIIYISTDAVFPANLHLAKETDLVSPESIYGKSKELGEFFLKQSDRNYTVIRTTIVGGKTNREENNFVEWVVNSVVQNKEIILFDDVFFMPISVWDLAAEINNIIIPNDVKKIYHITGSEICSKFKFGNKLITELGLESKFVRKGSIKDFSKRAGRSNDQTLSIEKYSHEFDRKLPDLERTINQIKLHYE